MCQMLSNGCFGKKFDSPEAMFLEAMKNAQACSLIGLTEDFDESVRRLCRMYGWEVPAITPQNVLTPKNLVLSDSERSLIRAQNVYDQILYEHCRQLFAEPIAESRHILKLFWPTSQSRPAA